MAAEEKRVLVVEDEAGLAELFDIWLQNHFHVTVATDGEEAQAQLGDGFDALVLDWRMPAVSGDEIVQTIIEEDLPISIVVVTGLDQDVIGANPRVEKVLCKPIDESTLVSAVKDVLD